MASIHEHAARDYAALDDARLVACVLGGEREAFRTIMQRCNQRMYRVVRGILRDEAEFGAKAFLPLPVVDQRPMEIAAHRRPRFDGR